MVWLKIRENDIRVNCSYTYDRVVVWLKIRENDIKGVNNINSVYVVVWLKIRENDIDKDGYYDVTKLWFD